MFAWLNPLNAIVSAVGSYLNKKEDVSLEKYKVDGQVNVEAMKQDQAIMVARANLLASVMQYRGIRMAQYLFIYPVGVWFALVMYDSAFRRALPDGWTWEVLAPPGKFDYYMMGVFAYLFITAWKK